MRLVLSVLPPTRAYGFKAKLWRFAGIRVSPSARIVSSVSFLTSGLIEIGERTFIGHDVMFTSGTADIVVGSDVSIAPPMTTGVALVPR